MSHSPPVLLSLPLSSSPTQVGTCHGPDFPVPPQTNTQNCFVTVSFNRPERARGRWEKSLLCTVHSFCLTSLWCETAQYYGFGAPAFPDQWTLNTLSWGLCSGMVEMQIFPAPEVKSFLYLLNPKKEYIFFTFSLTVHMYLPAAVRRTTAQSFSLCRLN